MGMTMDLDLAIAAGDPFTIQAVAKRDADRAYRKGYIEGVQDYQVSLRYALDTGPATTPIAWFRFVDDARLAATVLSASWDDIRVVHVDTGEEVRSEACSTTAATTAR